jgi:hypothetical protein
MLNDECRADSSFIIHHSAFIISTRPRGAAWSARLPVTQEIAGSNPAGDACDHHVARTLRVPLHEPIGGAVRKSAKRRSSNLRVLRVRLPPAPPWAVFLTAACKAVVTKQVRWTTRGPIPSQPTATEVIRLDEEPVLKTGGGPAPLVGSSPTASAGEITWPSGGTGRRPTLRTSRLERGMGVRISPWSLEWGLEIRDWGLDTDDPRRSICTSLMTRVSQCSTGPHKPGRPGATPGPATSPYSSRSERNA